FKHALTCDVAYGTLPRTRRARLHAGFARWLERFAGGRDEHAALLAHHYFEAVRAHDADLGGRREASDLDELRAAAARWLGRAGELAISRYEIEESMVLLERALELEADDAGRCSLYRAIARA